MAPEILRCEKYDAKVDLWSIGAAVYEAAAGRPPFRAQNPIGLLMVIDQAAGRIQFPDEVGTGVFLPFMR
jgi:serine/threonine-protein kinase ULK/ATG1